MAQAPQWQRLYDSGLNPVLNPRFANLLEAFRAGLAAAPEAPMIHYLDATLSWADVDRYSEALGAGLIDHGVSPGDRIALYLQNVPQFVISMVAAWKIGCIAALINPMNKERELVALLNDSGAKVLICLRDLYVDVVRGSIDRTGVDLVITTSPREFVRDRDIAVLKGTAATGSDEAGSVDSLDLMDLIRRYDGVALKQTELESDAVAFLTYTSGTTGPPKGAMNTHANAVFTGDVFRVWCEVDSSDVIFGIAPLFHITGLIGHVALNLVSRAPLVLGYRFDADLYMELVERYRATFTIGAITAFTAWMNSPDAGNRDISSLRKVYSGGQAVPAALVERFEKQFGAYIHIAYGLTETTSPTHLVPLHGRAPVDEQTQALSVGPPVFGTAAMILDEDGQPLPAGSVGEIAIKGPGIVPGYWQKPEETANAIVDGWLHTGDLGYMREDGWFFVIDRMKDLINASGYKVWPREVEDVLVSHEAVMEAAVVGVADEYRGESVKAFVSLRPGASVDEAALIEYARAHLAAYKYPRSIEIVAEIPKTASGKILRRELRATK